jgi:hypothetical protein
MEESEIDALFEFRKKTFPENNKQMDRVRWRWLYLANPEGNGSIPVWVLKTEGGITGSIAAVPTRVRIGKDSCVAFFGTDYFVDREYLGLPALRLLKTMLAESALNIGANMSASAQRLFAKIGYADLSPGLIQVSAFVPPKSGTGNLATYLKRVSRKIIRKMASPLSYKLEVTPKLPDSYGKFWDDIASSLEVSVVKDARYLRWRYEQCPSADYRFILLNRDGKLSSLAVAGIVADRNGARHGIILELLARDGDTFAACGAINACLDYFALHDCGSCVSHLSESWISRCYSLMGFSSEPSKLGFMALPATGNDALHKTKDAKSWAFALGDTDRY